MTGAAAAPPRAHAPNAGSCAPSGLRAPLLANPPAGPERAAGWVRDPQGGVGPGLGSSPPGMRAPFEAPETRRGPESPPDFSHPGVRTHSATPRWPPHHFIAPPFPLGISGTRVRWGICPHPALTFAPLHQPGESDQSALAWGGMLVTMVTARRPGRAAHLRGPVSSLPGPGCEGEVGMDGWGGGGETEVTPYPHSNLIGFSLGQAGENACMMWRKPELVGEWVLRGGAPPYFSCRCRGLSWSTSHPLSLQELPEAPPSQITLPKCCAFGQVTFPLCLSFLIHKMGWSAGSSWKAHSRCSFSISKEGETIEGRT